MQHQSTRRQFVGGAAALAGATAAAAAAATTGVRAQAAEAAQADEPAWLKAPEPYASWDEELDCDVAVIGQGLAGVCAARKAAEDGAEVVTIEQGETFIYRSAQFGVLNSAFQKQFGFEYDADECNAIVGEICKCCNNRVDRGIWQRWARESGDIFDWMISIAEGRYVTIDPRETNDKYGLFYDNDFETLTDADGNPHTAISINNWPSNPEYEPRDNYYPMWPAPCQLFPTQDFVMDAVMEYMQAAPNVTQLFSTWGRQIITDEGGRAVGVFCEGADGKVTKVNAKNGVVIACGDYACNEEMRDYYLPEAKLFPMWIWYQTDAAGELTSQGMGLKLGHWAGGKVDDNPHAFLCHCMGGALGTDPFLFVDKDGRRFTNEDMSGDVWSAIMGHKRLVWSIFDDNYPEQVHTMPNGHGSCWKIVDSKDEEPWGQFCEGIGMRTREEVEAKCYAICDSVEELAEAMDVDVATLQATIDRYNELAHKGFDEDFGKRADRLYPIEKPPFYLSRFTNADQACFASLCGLTSNCEAQVLNEDLDPVPGLYVCGNSQGSRFSIGYPVTFMGVSHGLAMTYGYIAGKNAAARLS